MTPDAPAATRTFLEQGTRERSPLRVWIDVRWPSYTDPLWKTTTPPGYRAACPTCKWFGYGQRPALLRSAAAHARTCPALRLARLEAELEKLVERVRRVGLEHQQDALRHRFESYDYHNAIGASYGAYAALAELTDLLARHRQASHG